MKKINIPDTQPTETGDHPNNKEEEGWTQVTQGKNPHLNPRNHPLPKPARTRTRRRRGKNHRKSKNWEKKEDTKKRKETNKINEINVPNEELETSTNLKRRRYSGDSITEGEGGKQFKNMPTKTISQKQQRPAQIIPPPQQPKNTPADPTECPLSPTPPPLSPISTPKLLSWSHSATRDSTSQSSSPSNTKQRAKSASR